MEHKISESDRICLEVDQLLDEIGPLPDKSEENKRRLSEIEAKIGKLFTDKY